MLPPEPLYTQPNTIRAATSVDQEHHERGRVLGGAGKQEEGQVPDGDDDADGGAGRQEAEPGLQAGKGEPAPAELLQQPGEQAGDQRRDPAG